MTDLVGMFRWETWKTALLFRRKTEGLNDLKDLKCPICEGTMVRYKNEGLNFEEKLFSVIPYYCADCKRDRDDYPVFNLGWRSEEARATIYYIVVALIFFGIILLLKVMS